MAGRLLASQHPTRVRNSAYLAHARAFRFQVLTTSLRSIPDRSIRALGFDDRDDDDRDDDDRDDDDRDEMMSPRIGHVV